MRTKLQIDAWAKKIAKENGFQISKSIYKGTYYTKDKVRNAIYTGTYKKKDSVLKVYDDPRITYEPISLKLFHQKNKSKLLTAPKLYKYKIFDPHTGWFIIEKLPPSGKFFNQPMKELERKEFLNVYIEYRKNFPTKPTRPLMLAENLTAADFHVFRISRWLELANKKEEAVPDSKRVLDAKIFIPFYARGLKLIRREFSKRKMVWSHGHFKPHEIYCLPQSKKYYLIDFAHTHLFPEGYEFGFIIWADHLMSANVNLKYSEWKKGVYTWIEDIRPVAKKLKIQRYNNLIRASLVERILGMILADITSSDKPKLQKQKFLRHLFRLLEELL